MQVSLVKTCLSSEMCDVFNVHTGKRQGAMDHITLTNRWKISLKRCRTQYNIQLNGMFVLSSSSLCQGISELVIGCCTKGGCHVTSIATPCSTQSSHQPEAILWHRSLQPTLGGAKATPCHASAKPMMLFVSFLHGRESNPR